MFPPYGPSLALSSACNALPPDILMVHFTFFAQKEVSAPAGYLSWLKHHPNRPRLWVQLPVRAHARSNQWMHNKWNNKINVSLSLSLSLSLKINNKKKEIFSMSLHQPCWKLQTVLLYPSNTWSFSIFLILYFFFFWSVPPSAEYIIYLFIMFIIVVSSLL